MGAGDPSNVKWSTGRLAVDPTDLSQAFPHGGTEVGHVAGARFLPGYREGFVRAAEYGRESAASIRGGMSPRLVVDLLQWFDDEAIALGWPNVSGDAGAKVVSHPGSNRAGYAPTPRVLVYTPDDPTAPGFYAYAAAPLLRRSAQVPWSVARMMAHPVEFQLLRNSDGDSFEWGALANLQATAETIFGADLALWLDASDSSSLTTDANGVSSWANKVSGGTPSALTQASDSLKPDLSSINGRQALLFDEAEYLVGSGAPVTAAPFHVFIVTFQEPDVSSYLMTMVDPVDADPEGWRYRSLAAVPHMTLNVASGNPLIGASAPNPEGQAFIFEHGEESALNRTLYMDGAAANILPPLYAVPEDVAQVALGARVRESGGTVDSEFAGRVAEIIVVAATPTTGQLAAMRAVLSAKWGVTLS